MCKFEYLVEHLYPSDLLHRPAISILELFQHIMEAATDAEHAIDLEVVG